MGFGHIDITSAIRRLAEWRKVNGNAYDIPEQFDAHRFAAEIKARAKSLGFDLSGIAPAGPSAWRDLQPPMARHGQAGTMQWLAQRFDERRPTRRRTCPVTPASSAWRLNYHVPLEDAPAGRGPEGRVARYALGDDYHEIIKPRLHALADWLRDEASRGTRAAVDTAPVMEKELAARGRRRVDGQEHLPHQLSTSARGCCWARSSPRSSCRPMSRRSTAAARAGAASTPARPAPSPRPTSSMPAAASRT